MGYGEHNRHLSESAILDVAARSLHKTFGELGLGAYRNQNNKGGLGNFVEEHVYGYPANSDDNPDFVDAGIELKVTPVQRNKNGEYSSKERLVLNMIDYFEEANATFETSSFYKKNKRLLIWFYNYIKGKPETEFEITAYDIFEFEHSVEFVTIKRDWETIHNKIVSGKAHEISESDTTFLAACTKGAGHGVTRMQPFSVEPAKPRAYSFKNSFMTRLYREIIHKIAPYSSFVGEDEWLKDPLEEIYKRKLSIYYGKTISELKRLLYVKTKAKDLTRRLAQKMLNLQGNDMQTAEMADANIKLKCVRLKKDGMPHEAMSFPAFDFTELINTDWYDSSIREEFCEWKLMFFVFRDNDDGEPVFERVLFWNVPNSIVDGVIKRMYESAAKLIASGDGFELVNGEVRDVFPKENRNSNGVCHIRPHGRDKSDQMVLPVPDKKTGITTFTKQAFWFNRSFIEKTIKELIDMEVSDIDLGKGL